MKKFAFLIVISCFLLNSCKKNNRYSDSVKIKGNVFGTTYNITYLGTSKEYRKSIDSLFYLVNKSLSTYMPTSDISKINKGDSTIVIDNFFTEVFKKSKKIHKETNGYFDITVGNLVNAWGFGPKKERIDLDSAQVKKQMKFVGFNKVSLLNGKIKKEFPEIYLDVNSIAKGYGIDVIGRFFESKNLNNYLVEIGGEIRARGKKNNGKPWNIKLQNPQDLETKKGFTYLNLENVSMATSGNYRKSRIGKDGQKYVHTINPKTGFAFESNLLSASVFSSIDCADVDAYATAFMAMGLEKTKAFLKEHKNLKVILIYMNNEGSLTQYKNYSDL